MTPETPSPLRRALKAGKVLAKRHLQDIAPSEARRARRDHVAVVGAIPELDGIEAGMAPHSARLTPLPAPWPLGHESQRSRSS